MEGASMLEARFEPALANRSAPDNSYVGIREITERGMIDLRGLPSDRKFMAAAKAVLGAELPKVPRTTATWGDVKVLWLAPDQWLVTCPRARAQDLTEALSKACEGLHALAVNVSDMRAIIRLEGELAREVVMKGSTLDLTDGSYAAGTVRRMRFADIAALLHIAAENTIEVYVFRSYAHYAFDFLVKASRKGSEIRLFPGAR
jgi:sarcosine oxidase subunit gamma